MNLDQLKRTLNVQQYQAVSLKDDENALILAGAGSGKTRILTQRIAYLCEHKAVLGGQILAVTFTNKAAFEMKQRLQKLLSVPIGRMWIGTFHGLALRMLQHFYQQTKAEVKLSVIDSSDQLRIIKEIIKSTKLNEKIFVAEKIRHFINSQKNEGYQWQYSSTSDNFFIKQASEIYQQYQAHCNANYLLDFGEILLQSYELLKNNDEIRDKYQQQFSHILIDEFQDTNHIQYKWMQILYKSNTIFCVGDDDQSIYGWRGAKIENIYNIQQDFAPVRLIRLEQNYRSTGHILATANHLISNNSKRLGKVLWTEAGDGEYVDILQTISDKEEVTTVIDRISTYLDNQVKANECAILYRTNAQSRLIEESLISRGIAYQIYGGLRFFDREEIKDTISYLRLLLNVNDDIAFERVVNKPARAIGPRTIAELKDIAWKNNSSLWQAAKLAKLSSRKQSAVGNFIGLIEKLTATNTDQSLSKTFDNIVDTIALASYYGRHNSEIAKNKQQNLAELVGAAREYEQSIDDSLLNIKQGFIDNAVLDSGNGKLDSVPSVQLMTIHAAKGLEFSYVFIVGLEEGLFPSSQSYEQDPLVLEERRLCYVAMTRAMKKLHLSFAQQRFIWGQHKQLKPSRFLQELPKKHLNISASATIPTTNSSTANGYKAGDEIIHEKFGIGTVTDCQGKGDHSRVEVNFKQYGKKWLILAYAKITKV